MAVIFIVSNSKFPLRVTFLEICFKAHSLFAFSFNKVLLADFNVYKHLLAGNVKTAAGTT